MGKERWREMGMVEGKGLLKKVCIKVKEGEGKGKTGQ